MMTHDCSESCTCRSDLNRAAEALLEASRMLSASFEVDSDDLIEDCWARVRVAKARVQGARAVYLEHRQEVAESCR